MRIADSVNGDLREYFKRWYPTAAANTNTYRDKMEVHKNIKQAA